jgi:hypothetical protein
MHVPKRGKLVLCSNNCAWIILSGLDCTDLFTNVQEQPKWKKNQTKACTHETLLIERVDQLVHPHPASVFINHGQSVFTSTIYIKLPS